MADRGWHQCITLSVESGLSWQMELSASLLWRNHLCFLAFFVEAHLERIQAERKPQVSISADGQTANISQIWRESDDPIALWPRAKVLPAMERIMEARLLEMIEEKDG